MCGPASQDRQGAKTFLCRVNVHQGSHAEEATRTRGTRGPTPWTSVLLSPQLVLSSLWAYERSDRRSRGIGLHGLP